jgi:putative ABC transport system permease protein
MLFHWKYADERSVVKGQVGWFVELNASPDRAAEVATAIDAKFANSPHETKTDTERAFQSSFVSMFGNLTLLLGSIAAAVVITTLFVAGNTMAMSLRERTTEIAVMRTLGFPARTIFLLVAGEALLISLAGGAVGALGAWAVVNPEVLQAPGGFLPPFGVSGATALGGVALGAFIGLGAGLIPAALASRLSIVDGLRRVA